MQKFTFDMFLKAAITIEGNGDGAAEAAKAALIRALDCATITIHQDHGGHIVGEASLWNESIALGMIDGEDVDGEPLVEPMAITDGVMLELLCENADAWDGEEDSVKEEHADLIAKTDAFIKKARAATGGPKASSNSFVEGKWSFRHLANGFDVYPKGERSHWSRRADMRLASDGKTWMFTAMRGGKGRQDARPTFAEAKAEVLRVLNQAEG